MITTTQRSVDPKITPGNGKLGPDIWAWSLPARETCPGRTELCSRACYATRGHFIFDSVKSLYEANAKIAKSPKFVDFMVAQLVANRVRNLRIHVSGDFYSAAYIRKWVAIVSDRRTRGIRFFAFTRSWRVRKLLPELLTLGAQRRMQLWWSCDDESGPGPAAPRIRQAYMATPKTEAAEISPEIDLVFRTVRNTVMKRTPGGVQVCPVENGVPTGLNCSRCRLCFRVEPVPRGTPSRRNEDVGTQQEAQRVDHDR